MQRTRINRFPCCSRVLGPLTDLIGTGPFVCLPIHQQTFDAMKALLVADTLMHYPDHNIPFHIITGTSDYQLGSVIMQIKAQLNMTSQQ